MDAEAREWAEADATDAEAENICTLEQMVAEAEGGGAPMSEDRVTGLDLGIKFAGPGPHGTTGELTEQNRRDLRHAHLALSNRIYKKRRQAILDQAVGQYQRAHDVVRPGDAGLGSDLNSVNEAVFRLTNDTLGPLVVLPNRRNRKLVFPSPYSDADPPNPYLWLGVLRELQPRAAVWEVGATDWASCHACTERLGICWALPQLGRSKQVHLRSRETPSGVPHSKVNWNEPLAVLVPLPPPVDRWSIFRTARRALADHEARGVDHRLGIWDYSTLRHPEFAGTLDDYLEFSLLRLAAVASWVPTRTRIVVTAREQLGVPHALRQRIRKRLGWHLIAERWATEDGGVTHLGDGRDLGMLRVSEWSTP